MADCANTRQKRYYAKNRDKVRVKKEAYRAANRNLVRDQTRESTRRHRQANPGRRQELGERRKYLYGITPEEVDALIERQRGLCPICEEPLGEKTAVDHCHDTGVVRGILHPLCNAGMGTLKDDPARLRRAADYLERTRRT